MDTRGLAKGQRVFMLSRPYCDKGTVTEVLPDGVIVRKDNPERVEFVRFDSTGESLDGYGSDAGSWFLDHVLSGKDAEPYKSTIRRRDDPSTW